MTRLLLSFFFLLYTIISYSSSSSSSSSSIDLAMLFAAPPPPVQVEAKNVQGTVRLRPKDVKVLTSFSFAPGGYGEVTGSFKYRSNFRATLYMFMDTVWDSLEQGHSVSCEDAEKLATTKLPLIEEDRNEFSGKGALHHWEVTELKGGKSELTFGWRIDHRVRTYGWRLLVGDCDPPPKAPKRYRTLEYDINLYSPGQDHFPADEHGSIWFYLATFLVLTMFAGYKLFLRASFARSGSSGGGPGAPSVDKAVFFLSFAYALQVVSVFAELIHLWRYRSNGIGYGFADFSSEFMEGLSQTMISYLLLSLASGWSLAGDVLVASTKQDKNKQQPSLILNPDAVGDDHPATWALMSFTVLTSILQVFNKLMNYNNWQKFHDFETIPGKILVLLRALLGAYFLFNITQFIRYQSRGSGGQSSVVRFLQALRIYGGLWFIAFPFLVVIAGFFAHYLRHRVVTVGVLVTQSVSLMVLMHQLYSTTSNYVKASGSEFSDMFPGGSSSTGSGSNSNKNGGIFGGGIGGVSTSPLLRKRA